MHKNGGMPANARDWVVFVYQSDGRYQGLVAVISCINS